jgi:spore germination protein GerM
MRKKIIIISSFTLIFLFCIVFLILNLREFKNIANFRELALISNLKNVNNFEKIDKEKMDDHDSLNKKKSNIIIYYGNEEGTLEEKSVTLTKENDKIEKIIFDEIKEDTDILENVEVISVETVNGICNLNVTEEFVSSLQGSIGEEITIYSIVNSLTELKFIDKVQFFIEGKKGFETGHNTYYEPIVRDEGFLE